MTQTTHPEHDEEREALARKVFELMTHGGQITEGERLRKDSRSYAIADFILAYTAKAVEEAERAARIDEHLRLAEVTKRTLKTKKYIALAAFALEINEFQKSRLAELSTPTLKGRQPHDPAI